MILSYIVMFFVYLGIAALPIAAIVWFALNVVQYRSARKVNEKFPGHYSEKQMKIFKIRLIVSSVLFGVLALILLTVVIVFGMAIIFM